MTGFQSKKAAALDKLAQPAQEPVALPCCGYTDASAVKWNPFNSVVQCHNCGQVYTTPPAQPEQEPVAWPCLIDTADFSKGTVTIVMRCTDYTLSTGKHWLCTTPPQENT